MDTSQFTGTTNYYKFSIIFPNVVLTDGSKYVAETAGAFWLMDMIASYLPYVNDDFAVARLKVDNKTYSGMFTLEDGNYNVQFRQKVSHTDFPEEEFLMFVAKSGVQDANGNIRPIWVIYLPSEH